MLNPAAAFYDRLAASTRELAGDAPVTAGADNICIGNVAELKAMLAVTGRALCVGTPAAIEEEHLATIERSLEGHPAEYIVVVAGDEATGLLNVGQLRELVATYRAVRSSAGG